MARLWQKLKQAAGTDNVPYPESNPLSKTGKKILANMNKMYGDRGEEIFYRTMNKKRMRSKWEK